MASHVGTLMVDALRRGDQAEAKLLADELVALGTDLTRHIANASPDQKLWAAQALEMAPDFKLRYGQALYLSGRTLEAQSYLIGASQTSLLGSEADVWLYAIYERQGQKADMVSWAA